MMSLRRGFLFSLIPLVLVGCTGEVTRDLAKDSSVASTNNVSAPSTQLTPIASSANAMTSKVARSGRFVSGEHPTQGMVRLVTQNGQAFLELDRTFKTSDLGPDLVVILHRSVDVLGSTKPPAYPIQEGDYLFLAPLQKFSGAQRYAIPAGINLADYNSAAIWCRKFNATFGAAKLIHQ